MLVEEDMGSAAMRLHGTGLLLLQKERTHRSPHGLCGTHRDICYNSLSSALRSYNNNISTEFPEGVSGTTGKADKFQSIYQSTSRQMKQQSCLVRNVSLSVCPEHFSK